MIKNKLAKILKNVGEKVAVTTVSKESPPLGSYQPAVPKALKK